VNQFDSYPARRESLLEEGDSIRKGPRNDTDKQESIWEARTGASGRKRGKIP